MRLVKILSNSVRKVHYRDLFKPLLGTPEHVPIRKRSKSFGKRFAVRIGDFERSIIDTSLTKSELKTAFKMMDENNGKTLKKM